MAHARPEEDIDTDMDLVCQTLPNGYKIPKLGYCTARSPGGQDLEHALTSGYRHFTLWPRSERDNVNVGNVLTSCIKRGKLQRNELFISLLFDVSQHGAITNANDMITDQLASVGCDYFDMVILHKSDIIKPISDSLRQRNTVLSLWKGLEKLVHNKLTRSLSLSNFRREEVDLVFTSPQIKTDVIWFLDPPEKLGWKDLNQARCYCQYNEIKMGVIQRLDRPEKEWVRSTCLNLSSVSIRRGHTPIQVFQRFHIQKNILVSLATDHKNIASSFQILDFHLTKEDVDELQNIPG